MPKLSRRRASNEALCNLRFGSSAHGAYRTDQRRPDCPCYLCRSRSCEGLAQTLLGGWHTRRYRRYSTRLCLGRQPEPRSGKHACSQCIRAACLPQPTLVANNFALASIEAAPSTVGMTAQTMDKGAAEEAEQFTVQG